MSSNNSSKPVSLSDIKLTLADLSDHVDQTGGLYNKSKKNTPTKYHVKEYKPIKINFNNLKYI